MQPPVERIGVLAARDRGQQRGGAVELPGLGEELDDAVPAARLVNGPLDRALDELRGAALVAGSPVRGDRGPDVRDGRLAAERLEEVEQQLGVLGALLRAPAPHPRIAELAEQDPDLAVDPAPLRGVRGPAVTDALEERRAAQVHAAPTGRRPAGRRSTSVSNDGSRSTSRSSAPIQSSIRLRSR